MKGDDGIESLSYAREITQELGNLTGAVAFKGSGDRSLLSVEGMSCQETERLELGLFPFSSRPPPPSGWLCGSVSSSAAREDTI